MSFSVWFKNWIRAFCKLMTFDYKKPKSDAQRKREREYPTPILLFHI